VLCTGRGGVRWKTAKNANRVGVCDVDLASCENAESPAKVWS
jgi:hypothetical protein